MLNVRKIRSGPRPATSKKRRPDRRLARTRARLGEALRKLMAERPLEKISVQDVIKLAGMSRSAFYAHYDDKVDLLLSDMEEFLERMAMLLVLRDEKSDRIVPVREFFAHVGESVEIRGALARSGRLQDFFDLAVEHFARGIEARLKQISSTSDPLRCSVLQKLNYTIGAKRRSGSRAARTTSRLIAHALAGTFVGLLKSWILENQPHSPETMDKLFHGLVWTGFGAGSVERGAGSRERGNVVVKQIRASV